ncbi:MAG TPA: hypothetical protein VF669_12585 [Tepidisphaeraceae bacterium]|jgi:hypothetical protein
MRAVPLIALLLLVASCSSPNIRSGAGASGAARAAGARPVSRFISATISRKFNSNGVATNDRRTVADTEELVALESFFPQAGTSERGPLSGGWQPAVTIQFKRATGRSVRVITNYEVWSEGLGDWPVRPALKDHLDRLFARRAS